MQNKTITTEDKRRPINPRPYTKPHKFFDKYLDNDLNRLSDFLSSKYVEIEEAKVSGTTLLGANGQNETWVESGSLSTVKWREYNVFQFHDPQIYKLYKAISDTVKEACEYYGIDFEKEQYMVQGWFNINQNGNGKLDWHDHGGPWAPFFHGYYCINAEPSITYYKINNDSSIPPVENHNVNNRLIVSEMGHPHAQGDWDWDGKRITLAYDIMPLRFLGPDGEQHWIPLL